MISIPQCPSCVFLVNNSPNINSCPSDLVFSVFTSVFHGVFTHIRTLRQTGCKATCIIYVDKIAYGKSRATRIFNDCFVTLRLINESALPPNNGWTNYIALIRFKLLFDLLHESHFNRVLLIDIFDAFYQGDPFTADIHQDTLYFQTEGFGKAKNVACAIDWIRNSYRPELGDINPAEMADKLSINPGILIGGSEPFKLLCDDLWKRMVINGVIDTQYTVGNGNEQAVIALMIYSGWCSKRNVNCKIESFEESVYGHFGFSISKVNVSEPIGHLKNKNGAYYLVVHQHDRNPQYQRKVFEACPMAAGHPLNTIRQKP